MGFCSNLEVFLSRCNFTLKILKGVAYIYAQCQSLTLIMFYKEQVSQLVRFFKHLRNRLVTFLKIKEHNGEFMSLLRNDKLG